MKTLTKVLIILAIFVFLFIVCMIVTFWVKDSVPDVLIQCVLGTSSAELICTALIEIFKIMKGFKNGNSEDSN